VEADPAREVPLLFELHDRLSASIPTEQRPGAIVHGDYRVDNCVLDPAGTVIAVLDWEMATLGDPLADLAWLVAVWGDALDSFSIVRDAPTVAPGFETRAQVAERYARASGLDLDPLPWYLAFTYWKQGCIVEGVYARRRRGVTAGAEVTDIEGIATQADKLFEVAAARLADV
jgi:aminoglycoside phosphotransferase (APT) family kinase protein